jgi:hypothetical protein
MGNNANETYNCFRVEGVRESDGLPIAVEWRLADSIRTTGVVRHYPTVHVGAVRRACDVKQEVRNLILRVTGRVI